MERASYCKENNCPWLDEKRGVCTSPNDIHGNKCDFDNGILPGCDDDGIKLKMVTWDGDLTQFLVEAETRDEAISKAITANKEFDKFCYGGNGRDNFDLEDCDIEDRGSYDVSDIDFDILCEIIERNDWFKGKFGEAKVFND